MARWTVHEAQIQAKDWMILLDTNVLVAIVNPADGHYRRVMQELPKVTGPFYTCEAVLTESFHLLGRPNLRARLIDFVAQAPVGQLEAREGSWPDIFSWLERYQEHSPDFTDAVLVHLLSTHKRAKIWTFDHEFSTIWGMSSRVVNQVAGKSRR